MFANTVSVLVKTTYPAWRRIEHKWASAQHFYRQNSPHETKKPPGTPSGVVAGFAQKKSAAGRRIFFYFRQGERRWLLGLMSASLHGQKQVSRIQYYPAWLAISQNRVGNKFPSLHLLIF